MVSSSHSRGTTESILFDTVGNIRKGGLVIETQSLRTSRKRNTPVDSLWTILGTGDRFTNISQEKGTSCKYLDIDKSQHLYLFYMSLQFGAIATAAPVAINRIIGLVNAGNMRKNIGWAPRRPTLIGIWSIAMDSHIRSYGINGFLITTNDSRLFDISDYPVVHVSIFQRNHFFLSLHRKAWQNSKR